MNRRIGMMARVWIIVCILLLAAPLVQAYPGIDQSSTFIFSDRRAAITIPDAYKLSRVITIQDPDGKVVNEPQDLFCAEDGRVFVLDGDRGRVLIYGKDYSLQKVLDQFTMKDGELTRLNKPEGLFVTKGNTLLIADTANQRVLHTTQEGEVLSVTHQVEAFRGTSMTTFLPTKAVIDSAGRVTAIARNINMGLLQFDASGHFTGYVGAPKVKVNFLTKLWKRFSTQAQRAQMEQFVPTEYSSIVIDERDFIYGTISSISFSDAFAEVHSKGNPGNYTPIRKINTIGSDVLKRHGMYSPIGNLDLSQPNSVSRMIDVALGPSGSYTLLDSSRNILYTYSEEGVLLHAFGGSGKSKKQFERAIAIGYQGNNLLVLDSILSQLMVYKPTQYGLSLLEAIDAEYRGDFAEAYGLWNDIVRMNASFRYAYIGIGKIRYDEGDYNDAMTYYQYASNRTEYEKAKEKHRSVYMGQAFPMLFAGVGILVAVFSIRGVVRRTRQYMEKRVKP